jgi:hypothetical protein
LPILNRIRQAWNAFRSVGIVDDPTYLSSSYGSYGSKPDRLRLKNSNEKSIVTSILTRISIDVAGVSLRHVTIDSSGRYIRDVDSGLNRALNIEPNLDQGPRAFRQDVVMTLFDRGCMAVVPIDTTIDAGTGEVLDIHTLRVGEIVTWYPKHVRVSVYNEATGKRQEVVIEKRLVAIIENPLFAVMNQPNSTLQRLIRKLNLLDVVDEQSSSGKLDLIIQLPYVVKTEARKAQAEARRTDIELQLKGSQYGIAYADATEKITQLNRPAENNLLKQIEYLTVMLYGQLGITEEIMNGTAEEKAMINYYDRTIEPVVEAFAEAMRRSFLVNRMDQKIEYFRNPFKLVPLAQIAEIADKFTRNEILSSNEIRGFMGIPPSTDPKADQLVNSNMPQPAPTPQPTEDSSAAELRKESQNGS